MKNDTYFLAYPYTAVDGTCQFSPSNVGAKISNWTMVPGTDDQMGAWLVNQGPLSIAVDATWWQFYIEGMSNVVIICVTTRYL